MAAGSEASETARRERVVPWGRAVTRGRWVRSTSGCWARSTAKAAGSAKQNSAFPYLYKSMKTLVRCRPLLSPWREPVARHAANAWWERPPAGRLPGNGHGARAMKRPDWAERGADVRPSEPQHRFVAEGEHHEQGKNQSACMHLRTLAGTRASGCGSGHGRTIRTGRIAGGDSWSPESGGRSARSCAFGI